MNIIPHEVEQKVNEPGWRHLSCADVAGRIIFNLRSRILAATRVYARRRRTRVGVVSGQERMPADPNGSKAPVRSPRVAARLIVAVSGLVLLALLGLGPAAWLASAHSALPPQGEPRPPAATDRSVPLGLRAVPIYRANGVVAQAFGPGTELPSQAQLDRAIDSAASSLAITQLPRIRTVLSRTFSEPLRPNARYPFAYPRLDPLVAEALPVDLMRSRPAEINDLAALLILQGAHRRDMADPTHEMSAAAAYAILNRLGRPCPLRRPAEPGVPGRLRHHHLADRDQH